MRMVASVLVALVFAAVASGVWWLRRAVKTGRVSEPPLIAAGIGCFVLFIAVNISDWPGTVFAQFWADHAIFAATASTLPLLGVGYFVFETYENAERKKQGEIDESVAATGRGGVVDHLVDVDVAMSLMGWPQDRVISRWPEAAEVGRPMRWLRERRELLYRTGTDHAAETDPRAEVLDHDPEPADWRIDLVDQAIRRIMVGIKEWGPVLAQSSTGRNDLIQLGDLRRRLLVLAQTAAEARPTMNLILDVQRISRNMAFDFEQRSGVQRKDLIRREVLSPNPQEPA